MAKKKTEQLGQGIGFVAGIALVAALLAATILPLFLLFRYLQQRYLAYKLQKDYNLAEYGWWLTADERDSFKESCASEYARLTRHRREYGDLEKLIEIEDERASAASISINDDGTYSRKSNLGKEIRNTLDELYASKRQLDLNLHEISCRQPIEFWDELNDLLRKQDVAFVALLGWVCGAFFFYSAHQQGAPFDIWLYLFVPALCAGVGAAVAALFSRNPAVRYMPKPVAITIENVDTPEMELPQNSRFALKLVGVCVWIGIMIVNGKEGRQYGAEQATAHREQIKVQQALASENERRTQEAWDLGHSPSESATTIPKEAQPVGSSRPSHDALDFKKIRNTVHTTPISPSRLSKLNSGEIEDLILIIYARYGADFESVSAQKWADHQPWYQKVPGKTIKDAEKEFSNSADNNVTGLVERWNRIQVEEGLAPVPVDESPLAGRAVSSDIEENAVSGSSVVLKALPVDEASSLLQVNLGLEEIQNWNLARIKYEINKVYARHGVVFPKQEIQAHFEKQAWYKPIPGLTFDQAEVRFSIEERHNIQELAARRDILLNGNQARTALPVSEPLSPELVAKWDAARVRNEINSIYASYGVDFTNADLRKWADKQPWYKCVLGRTFADADALFSETDRKNIEVLAARRSQINDKN